MQACTGLAAEDTFRRNYTIRKHTIKKHTIRKKLIRSNEKLKISHKLCRVHENARHGL